MKWFFAFNQVAEKKYGDLIRVAVISARQNTTLQAFCLYDGASTELTRWIEEQGVTLVPRRFRFATQWEELPRQAEILNQVRVAQGAFLRVEIPDVLQSKGDKDEFVLYTDCDVVFESDPSPLLRLLQPRFFAVAPETFKHNYLHMNSGVMWMNVNNLRRKNVHFMPFVRQQINWRHLLHLDQEIYRAYFDPLHRLAWKLHISERLFYGVMSRLPLKTWQWDKLPLELNWKPYWGQNPDAVIIHFHGLKPTQRHELGQGALLPNIESMHTPFWDECVEKWDAWLEKAKR